MLKYIIAICIICIYKSESSVTGNYDVLILNQLFPTSQFFYDEIYLPYVETSSSEFEDYVRNHKDVFVAQNWVIDSLHAVDKTGKFLTNCVDSLGKKVEFHGDLDDKLNASLTARWPSLTVDGVEIDDWEMNYSEFGSCVNENAVEYFDEALTLLNNLDVGAKLFNGKITPGNEYALYRIVDVLKFAIGKKVYVDCVQPKNSDKQYLSSVQICLNKDRKVIDCQHQQSDCSIHKCDSSKQVQYPLVPPEYLHLL